METQSKIKNQNNPTIRLYLMKHFIAKIIWKEIWSQSLIVLLNPKIIMNYSRYDNNPTKPMPSLAMHSFIFKDLSSSMPLLFTGQLFAGGAVPISAAFDSHVSIQSSNRFA